MALPIHKDSNGTPVQYIPGHGWYDYETGEPCDDIAEIRYLYLCFQYPVVASDLEWWND